MSARPMNEDLGSSPRQLPIGGEMGYKGGVHFRVWAPVCARCARAGIRPRLSRAYIASNPIPSKQAITRSYCAGASAGTLYRYELDDDSMRYPDPASRFQPDGPHGPSQIIDTQAFPWTDQQWRGATREGQIIYEMHIGTFSRRGPGRARSASWRNWPKSASR